MCTRLHAATENRQHASVRRGQQLRGSSGDRGGSHFSDQTSVEYSQRFASSSPKQHDDALVRGKSEIGVAGKQGDELSSHDVAIHRGHYSVEAVIWRNGKYGTDGLHNAAARKVDQRAFHGRNQVLVAQDLADGGFAEIGNLRIGIGRTT